MNYDAMLVDVKVKLTRMLQHANDAGNYVLASKIDDAIVDVDRIVYQLSVDTYGQE